MKIKFTLSALPLLLALITAACSGAALPATPDQAATAATDLVEITRPAPTSTTAPAATDIPGCSVISETFVPEPPADSPFPAVSEKDWSQGPTDATITLVEYGDFQ